MTSRHDVDTLRRQLSGQELMSAGKAIIPAKPQVHGHGPGSQRADEAPDASLIVLIHDIFIHDIAGAPSPEGLRPGDLRRSTAPTRVHAGVG